jgi:acetoacetyl-CoA reductase
MGGLGEAISIRLHDAGYRVIVTYSPSNKGADEWLAAMEKAGRAFYAVPVDVADYDSCHECVAKITAEIGPVDILVNNAGITRDMTLRKLDKVNWDAVMRTNLDSVFNMTKPLCEMMVERGWGRVINVTTLVTVGYPERTSYGAAKAALDFCTRAWARELATRGVTVNSVAPGPTETETFRAGNPPGSPGESRYLHGVPQGRFGQPDEIAAAISFLLSDDAAFITGQSLNVCGGIVLS